jgi:ribosomal protein S14
MSTKQKISKDFLLRQKLFNQKYGRLIVKTLRFNKKIFRYKTYPIFLNLLLKFRNFGPKTYCFLSLRSRGVDRKFKIVRHVFKRFANQGLLYGVRKASF